MIRHTSDVRIPAWEGGELRPVEKLDVHRRGLRHKAVSVFVLCGNEVLIQRRAMGKYHTPGLWANTCCTHPHWGEDPADCAIRRLREELGISGLKPARRGRVEYRADVGGGLIEHEVVDLFTAITPADLEPAPDPEEVLAVRWIAWDDLVDSVAQQPHRYTPWLRIYLRDHSETILGATVPE